jgi:hypothetical protein
LVVAGLSAPLLAGFGIGLWTCPQPMVIREAQVMELEWGDSAFEIHYAPGGLARIDVGAEALCYVHLTHRRPRDEFDPSAYAANMSSLAKHEHHFHLTVDEEGLFKEWLTKHRPLEFPEEFPLQGGEPNGKRFEAFLAIREGSHRRRIRWDHSSKLPAELDAAIAELQNICRYLQKSRLMPYFEEPAYGGGIPASREGAGTP